MELYLVRHGETDFNRRRIVQGRGVDSELNDTGREQARRFHARHRHRGFHHVHVSALRRTHQTAEPFVLEGLPWSAHPELDEIAWGEQEGKKASDAMKRQYRRIIDGWATGALEVALPGGESPLDVAARMDRFLDAHIRPALGRGERRLVVSHGRAMRVLLCRLLDRPLTCMEDFTHGNTGLYRLSWNGRSFALEAANDRSHLDEPADA